MDLLLHTSQKVMLSQKMLQSTEILQMSAADLLEYVKELSVENPVVDAGMPEETVTEDRFDQLKRKLDFLDASDEQNRTYYADDREDEGENDGWKFKDDAPTLEAYLMEQVAAVKENKAVLSMMKYIVESMDANGYLQETAEEMAKGLALPVSMVRHALKLVQGLEPAGVGASSLQECLLLQLLRKEGDTALAQEMVAHHLELLAKNQLHTIAKKTKKSLEQVRQAAEQIRSLNPKPGNSFSSGGNCSYIVPDAIVVRGAEGFEIVLNDRYFPEITISPYYRQMMQNGEDAKTKTYILNKIKQAQWVMDCIQKRNQTLQRTLETIVEIQQEFFLHGKGHVRPMCLNDVASRMEMHESTVSRAVKQKYIQCQFGVFPLSYFFQSQVSSATDTAWTQEKVTLLIRAILEKEDKKSPYSDRQITELLQQQGVEISRRTVAKYREAAGILGMSGRKD